MPRFIPSIQTAGDVENMRTDAHAYFTGRSVSNSNNAIFRGQRARNAGAGVAGATEDNDILMDFSANGHTGSGFDAAGTFRILQDGAVSGGRVAGKAQIVLRPTGSANLAAAMTWRQDKSCTAEGSLKVVGSVGFYNTNPVTKATVTGSRGANAALASLLTALAATGLIADGTTA